MQSKPLIIRRSPAWRVVNARELWAFRDLVVILGGRDVKLRYRQTALGIAWVVLQPLLGAVIFAFIFGQVARLDSGGIPYFLFALVGMVAWGAFGGALTRVSGSLIQNPQLISKTFFPRLVIPLSTLLSVILDLVVGLCLVAVVMALYGVTPSWRVVTLPAWLAFLLALATGLGLFLAALTVSYRDVQHVLPVLVQLGFYATPVAYSAQVVPERFRNALLLNPAGPLMEAMRWSLFGQTALPVSHLMYAMLLTVVVLTGGALFFRHAERSFADVI